MKQFLKQNWRQFKFFIVVSIIVIIAEQAIVYSQIGRLNIPVATLYYAIDVPFVYVVAFKIIPRVTQPPYIFLKLLLAVALMLLSYTIAQNIADIIVDFCYTHQIRTHYWVYKNSIARAFTLLIFSIAFSWRERSIRIEKAKNELELKNKELEVAYLKALIDPHYIVNNLNFIYAKAESVSPELAKIIGLFSSNLRHTIRIETGNIPLFHELKAVRDTIELNRLRLGENLHLKVEILVEEYDMNLQIPRMLIMNFVENVFKHGDLSVPEKPGLIELKVSGNELKLLTRNIKQTGTKAQSTYIGWKYIQSQLDMNYNGRYRFEVNENDNYYQLHFVIKL